MDSIKTYPALIKSGANNGKTVYVQQYDANSGKFLIQWPNSPASIGYFHQDELHPDGGWYFGEDNELKEGTTPSPYFQNGSPMDLIEHGNTRAVKPILIELTSGDVTMARPCRGHFCHGQFYSSEKYAQDFLLLCDPDFDAPEVIKADYDNFVRLQDVIAWQPTPKTLR